jgi:hypothetical protein
LLRTALKVGLTVTIAIGGAPLIGAGPAAAYAVAPCVPGGPSASDGSIAASLNPRLSGRMRNALNAYRMSCARAVVDAVKARGLNNRAAVIAITTTIVESTIQNVAEEVDHDSLGLFQQRASWGTAQERLNPAWATNAFLSKMIKIYPNNAWATAPIGEVCQAVQVSAYPARYQPEAPDAQLIVNALWNGNDGRYADLTGDGFADLLALTTSGERLRYVNKGDGSGEFWSARSDGPASFRLMETGDVTGDGFADLFALSTDSAQLMYPNKGDGTFWSARNFGPAPGFRLMALGDMTGDGYADLLAVYSGGNELMLYPNKGDGTGTFWSARNMGYAPAFKLMDLGDLNGDGYADLFALTHDGERLVYLNKGDGTGGVWSSRSQGFAGFRLFQLGNLNGDRFADLYAVTTGNDQLTYMNKGDGTFWSARSHGGAPGFAIAAL